jgi:hypothetical protein
MAKNAEFIWLSLLGLEESSSKVPDVTTSQEIAAHPQESWNERTFPHIGITRMNLLRNLLFERSIDSDDTDEVRVISSEGFRGGKEIRQETTSDSISTISASPERKRMSRRLSRVYFHEPTIIVDDTDESRFGCSQRKLLHRCYFTFIGCGNRRKKSALQQINLRRNRLANRQFVIIYIRKRVPALSTSSAYVVIIIRQCLVRITCDEFVAVASERSAATLSCTRLLISVVPGANSTDGPYLRTCSFPTEVQTDVGHRLRCVVTIGDDETKSGSEDEGDKGATKNRSRNAGYSLCRSCAFQWC